MARRHTRALVEAFKGEISASKRSGPPTHDDLTTVFSGSSAQRFV